MIIALRLKTLSCGLCEGFTKWTHNGAISSVRPPAWIFGSIALISIKFCIRCTHKTFSSEFISYTVPLWLSVYKELESILKNIS